MAYAVSIAASALCALRKLPADVQSRIARAIDGLASNPRPAGVKKLKGSDAGLWRIRVDAYRGVYDIADRKLTVLALRISDRKDAY